jgi:hypothetical protein
MSSDLGYYIHPDEHSKLDRCWQLEINLCRQPTYEHFDPERIDIWIVEKDGDVTHTSISHPWRGRKHLQIFPGRVILHDRVDEVVEAYSFGGNLEIVSKAAQTRCQLSSPAPIIELFNSFDAETILVSKFEALLACLEAQWAGNELGFNRKLAAIDPFTLFIAGLVAVRERLCQLPPLASQQQTMRALNEIVHDFQADGMWPASPPQLSDLL